MLSLTIVLTQTLERGSMQTKLKDAFFAIALATLLWLLVGCGRPQFSGANDLPEVSYARWQAMQYFGLEALKTNVFLTDRETIKESCRHNEAVACYTPDIIKITGPSSYELCWQSMHEFGHAAEFRLTGTGSDITHTINADYYKNIIFSTCAMFK